MASIGHSVIRQRGKGRKARSSHLHSDNIATLMDLRKLASLRLDHLFDPRLLDMFLMHGPEVPTTYGQVKVNVYPRNSSQR